MDSALLVRTAAVVLAVAALGGLLMAGMRFAGTERPPSWLAMLHGLLAGAGLTLLLYAGFAVGIPRSAWIGIVLLVLAALGGVFLNLAYHDKRLPLPKGIMVVHALLAVAGFGLIFVAAFAKA
jgi:protein-S-isoprenylcysteine O-methyltransferase Ste14